MSRSGFGKAALKSELRKQWRLHREQSFRLYDWVDIAQYLAKLVRDRKYKKARALSTRIIDANPWTPMGALVRELNGVKTGA